MATNSTFADGFDADEFIDDIRQTMRMGMPEDDAEKLTWWWERSQTFSPDDAAGEPYDWDSDPITDEPGNPDLADAGDEQSLIVDYALEFSSRPAGSTTTVLGDIDNSRIEVTLLPTDYDQVKTADYATIGQNRFRIQFHGAPVGMFGVTVYTVILEALDMGSIEEPS